MIEQDAFIMGAMEWCLYVRRLHGVPLKEYGKLSADQFKLIDRIKRVIRG